MTECPQCRSLLDPCGAVAYCDACDRAWAERPVEPVPVVDVPRTT